jgi:hypothetical protein
MERPYRTNWGTSPHIKLGNIPTYQTGEHPHISNWGIPPHIKLGNTPAYQTQKAICTISDKFRLDGVNVAGDRNK